MSPFRNILTLSAGDFISKAAYFLAFVYMAQKLAVASYGALEFALAIRTYLLLLADAGLELWAIREAARGGNVAALAARVVPARLILAVAALASTGLLNFVSAPAGLDRLLPLLTATVLVQTFNLKWVFMGQQRMARVAAGLIASQLAFAVCVFALVREPRDLMLVPAAFLAAEIVLAVYFGALFVKSHGVPRLIPDWGGIRGIMQPVLTLGAAQCLGLMSYNVGSILIGIMLGPGPVGWYAAAYKPVTAVLAAPVTYYQGLFPALSRSFHEDREMFHGILLRSVRLTAMFAIPVGIGGTLLAGPVIRLLFGAGYEPGVPALQLLSWSAVLVMMRGNFRHTLNAVGKQRLDLICAGVAAILNIAFNLVFIPRYGIAGSAAATVISEVVWFVLAWRLFSHHVAAVALPALVWRPVLAGAGMAACLSAGGQLQWVVRAAVAVGVYVLILLLAGDPELRQALARRSPAGTEPLMAGSKAGSGR